MSSVSDVAGSNPISLASDDRSMYVSEFQKTLIEYAYTSNRYLRELAYQAACVAVIPRDRDQISCPQRVGTIALSFIPALAGLAASGALYSMAALQSLFTGGGFEKIEPTSAQIVQVEKIQFFVLNSGFQDPWSYFTAGLSRPMQPIGNHETRVAAVVERIAARNDHIFFGQEFESIAAQNQFIELMKKEGYHYFVRDLGANSLLNHSGLLVASKLPLENIEFIPYSWADREGLAKGSNQGILQVVVRDQHGRQLAFLNTHMNYGGKEYQNVRDRQFGHVIRQKEKLEKQGIPCIIVGDFNGSMPVSFYGLVNALEGHVTCTDEPKHREFKERRPNCEDCGEEIDGIIYDPEKVTVEEVTATPLVTENGQFLTDHTGNGGRVQLKASH